MNATAASPTSSGETVDSGRSSVLIFVFSWFGCLRVLETRRGGFDVLGVSFED